jgi:hypothetical protein
MKLIKVKCKDAGTKVYGVEYRLEGVDNVGPGFYTIKTLAIEASSESNAKSAGMKEIEKRKGKFLRINQLDVETLEQFKSKYPFSTYLKIKAN